MKKALGIVCLLLFVIPVSVYASTSSLLDKEELDRLAFLMNSETRYSSTRGKVQSEDLFFTSYLRSFHNVHNQANIFTQTLFQTFFPFDGYSPDKVELIFDPSSPGIVLQY